MILFMKQFIALCFLLIIVQSQDAADEPESLDVPVNLSDSELDVESVEEFTSSIPILVNSGSSSFKGCTDGCHSNATCSKIKDNKHCCKCSEGYIGNGINCLRDIDYANVRGKINGRINGVELEEIQIIANANPMPNESKSQVVIVNTKTGTYQLMITLLTPIFWLFSTDGDNERSKTVNGFSLTGGTFKRSSWATFFDDRKQVIGNLNVKQNFYSEFTDGIGWSVIVETEIDGQLPQLSKNDVLFYHDFQQEYMYRKDENSDNHIIESNGRIHYKNIAFDANSKELFEIAHSERIEFSSCYDLEEFNGNPNTVVEVKDLVSLYDMSLKSLRFVQTHFILPANESKGPCDNNDCSEYAACYADRVANEYTCTCKNGYSGDGNECIELNECEVSENFESGYNVCSDHATCINTPGYFECRCNPPYVGNGRHCELEKQNENDACANCHPNAQCITVGGASRCECLRGYYGNGYVCQLDYSPDVSQESISGSGCGDCDVNAQCVKHENKLGSCCECNEGYVGNGKFCFYANQMVVLTGKINGYINGEQINDAEFFSSVLTLPDDSRNHAGIRFVPLKLASSFQSLISLTTSINWLFAGPHKSAIISSNEEYRTVVNGFTLTGGNFTRVAKVSFIDDSNNAKELTIEQEYGGLESKDGSLRINVNTRINGDMPYLSIGTRVHFRNFFQSYRLVRRGQIEGEASLTYDTSSGDNSDGAYPHIVQVSDRIKFDQCAFDRDYADSWKVNSKNTYVLHIKGDDLIRFTSTNFIYSDEAQDDPCELNTCSIYAECIPNDEAIEKYSCNCKAGFDGDGYTCQDVNECERDSSACDDNAICYNLLGHYECKCKSPYVGSGKECFFESACSACSTNAYCDTNGDNVAKCICNIGFFGNGYQCEPIRSPEDVCANCSPHAECIVNKFTRKFECKCKSGFVGSGTSCTPVPCNQQFNCGPHAHCEAKSNDKYECTCVQGYHGDGFKCTTQSCDILNNCGEHARCLLDALTQNYRCLCMQGYIGNGFKCVFDSQPCNIAKNCHQNAECLYDEVMGQHKCACKPGYIGDGAKCIAQNSCSKDDSICDLNAICIFEPRVADHICRCKSGYEGDGLHRRCYPMGEGPNGLSLVYAQGVSLHKVSLDRNEQDTVQPYKSRIVYISHQTAVAVDYDCLEQNVYWTDVSGRVINKVKADGSKYDVVLQDLQSPEGLAIDWVSRNIYITDSKAKTIEIANLKGTYRKVLIKGNLQNPRGIAVDPVDGFIYWADWNRKTPKIERSMMDGTHRTVLVKDNIGIPNGLYYDNKRREVCWGDAKTKRIECIGRDGNGRRNVTSQNGMHPFDITEVGQNIYWSDWTRKEIPTISKSGYLNEAIKLAPGGNGRIYGLAVVKQSCPAGTNSCAFNNGDCQYICVPLTNGQHRCICPDNVQVADCKTTAKKN